MFQRALEVLFSAGDGALAASIARRKKANANGPWHCEVEVLFCQMSGGARGAWQTLVTARSDDPEAGGFSVDTPYVAVYRSPSFDTLAQASAFMILQMDKAKRAHPECNFYRWVEPVPRRPKGYVYASLEEAMTGRLEKYEAGRWVVDTTDYKRIRF